MENESKKEQELEGLKYFLVTVDKKGTIVHICGYEEPPKDSDKQHVLEELRTDEEFGLTKYRHGLADFKNPDNNSEVDLLTFSVSDLPAEMQAEMMETINQILGRD